MAKVLNAHSLMVFLEKEGGFEKIKSFFLSAFEKEEHVLMTSVDFGEVYDIIRRECGEEKAREVEKIMRTLPIQIVDVDALIAKEAACLKANNRISYTDCFAAALARLREGELVTGDREFKSLEKEVRIYWIN